jgi:hypothetical protein
MSNFKNYALGLFTYVMLMSVLSFVLGLLIGYKVWG